KRDATPLGLERPQAATQGSSCLATLGWQTQSLWDCRTTGGWLFGSCVVNFPKFLLRTGYGTRESGQANSWFARRPDWPGQASRRRAYLESRKRDTPVW